MKYITTPFGAGFDSTDLGLDCMCVNRSDAVILTVL
jgi:hypothetical protein